jgi:hypothetical protein
VAQFYQHRKMKKLLVTAALVILTFMVGYPIFFLDTWSLRGTFGDMFGAANTALSLMATLLLISTIRQQSQMLDMQKEELKKSSAAQEKTAAAMSAEVKLLHKSASISALASMTETFSAQRNNLRLLDPETLANDAELQEELQEAKNNFDAFLGMLLDKSDFLEGENTGISL